MEKMTSEVKTGKLIGGEKDCKRKTGVKTEKLNLSQQKIPHGKGPYLKRYIYPDQKMKHFRFGELPLLPHPL